MNGLRSRDPKTSPAVLIAFLAFAATVVGLGFVGIRIDSLRSALVPITGGGAEAPYLASLLVALMLWRSDRTRACRFVMLAMAIQPFLGLLFWCREGSREDSNGWDPVHELGLVFTVLVPLLWLTALYLAYGVPARTASPRPSKL